jgi:hypothetical protein
MHQIVIIRPVVSIHLAVHIAFGMKNRISGNIRFGMI